MLKVTYICDLMWGWKVGIQSRYKIAVENVVFSIDAIVKVDLLDSSSK